MAAPIPTDPADHAEDFARRYTEPLDYIVSQIMLDLGIPPEKIGAGDALHGIQHAAFHPQDRIGGSVAPDGRIIVDSGIINPDLLTAPYGEEAARVWEKARLRHHVEAIVAHEKTEHEIGTHWGALEHAPDTSLPVSVEAREILRAMQRGWKGRS